MPNVKLCVIVAFLFCLLIITSSTSAAAVKFRVKTVASGLDQPRSVHVVSNGDIYIGEYRANIVTK